MIRGVVIFVLVFAAVAASAQAVLKPGDVVAVTCAEDPALNGEYTVSGGGLLLLPYLGAVEVKGLTEQQASEKIARLLVSQQILKKATITLRLKLRDRLPVSVGGAVRNAGDIPYTEGLSLADVLEFAQPTIVADLRAVRITSLSGETGEIDFTQYQGGNPAGNPLVRPGDKVFVPIKVAGFQVTVLGAVNKPGIVEFSEKMTLMRAIEASGGLRSDADASKIRVVPPAGSEVVVALGEGMDWEVLPGTKIVVGVREVTEKVFVRGAVARPGLIPYERGLSLSQAVANARPLEGARLDRVKITRKKDGKDTVITANLVRINANKAPDVELEPGDTIDVSYPVKSYQTENTMKLVGIALLLYFIFFR